jgi:adenosylcobinamide-GDP ribazoletransferase
VNGPLSALAFLTVLPVPGNGRDIGAGLRWFSGVGLLLGALAAGSWWLATQAWQGPLVPAVIAVGALAALTGMLHLDGLADVADAALVSASRERRAAILHDVHHGTFAIVAVTVVLLLKVAALSECSERAGVYLLAIVPACARGVLPLAIRSRPLLPSSSMAAGAAAAANPQAVALALVGAVIPAAILLGGAGVVVAGACVAAVLLTVAMLSRRFGGINGDCLGAAVELGETAGLLAGSVLLAHVRGGGAWGLA